MILRGSHPYFFSVLELDCQAIPMDHHAVDHIKPEPFVEMVHRLVQLTEPEHEAANGIRFCHSLCALPLQFLEPILRLVSAPPARCTGRGNRPDPAPSNCSHRRSAWSARPPHPALQEAAASMGSARENLVPQDMDIEKKPTDMTGSTRKKSRRPQIERLPSMRTIPLKLNNTPL